MIEKINDTLHSQTIAISDINYRLDRFDRDIQALQNPNYDQIFSYIDRQIANTVGDFERKIDVKADIKYVDTALPQRLEDLYRTMNVKINDMKVDIAKSATKEEFHALANQKARVDNISLVYHPFFLTFVSLLFSRLFVHRRILTSFGPSYRSSPNAPPDTNCIKASTTT